MEPWFDIKEQNAVKDYMESDPWLTEFSKTEAFEDEIRHFTNSKHCIVVNNGTISLTLAAIACGIESGDEVIVPNYTMIATPNSVKLLGAIPKFVDVERETLCLDYNLTKEAISERTKAIILVNANGRYPVSTIMKFEELCQSNDLILIEDSAQALGSKYPDGRHMGTVGLVGSFSFSAPKVISTGQGGCLITNSDTLAEKLRKLKDFGRARGGNDIHDSIGYNFKFTDIQAVIGIEQMKKLEWRVNRKKEIYARYKENLATITQVEFFDQDLNCTTPWFIDVLVESRDHLQTILEEKGIGSRVMYPPINKQTAYNTEGSHTVSNKVGEDGLWLPSASQLSNSQIDYVCEMISNYYASIHTK